jgi:hypothetical protein
LNHHHLQIRGHRHFPNGPSPLPASALQTVATQKKHSQPKVSALYTNMAAGKYHGLRGTRLRAAMLLLVVAPSFILFGYNNGSTGGISTLPSFVGVSQVCPLCPFPFVHVFIRSGGLSSPLIQFIVAIPRSRYNHYDWRAEVSQCKGQGCVNFYSPFNLSGAQFGSQVYDSRRRCRLL